MLATSCPGCEAQAPPHSARCEACGFVLFEERERRRFKRPGPLSLALLALVAALVAGGLVLLARDEPRAAPPAPQPVSQARAERRLELQFANARYDDTAAVRCRSAIRQAGATRCQVRYANGDTQLVLVGLDQRGELDVAIPYPAQRRPGD
jgi:hypothetical protein